MEDADHFQILSEGLDLATMPLRMIQTKNAGRSLVAARPISAGEELLREAPILRGPPQTKNLRCANCSQLIDLSNSLTNVDCPDCGLVLCHADCASTSGNSSHAADCRVLSKCALKQSHARLSAKWLAVFRALQRIRDNPCIWKKLSLLEHHLDRRRNCDLMQLNVIEVFDTLREILPANEFQVEKARVLRICGLLDGNAFRCDPNGERGVFPVASMLNHNCVPNARVVFDADKTLHLVAKQNIASDEEVTITYCSPLLSTPERQENLLKNKFFTCTCRRCRDPSEFDSFMSALNCPSCKNFVLPHWEEKKCSYQFRCRKCSFSTTQEKAAKLTEAAKAAQQAILVMKMPRITRMESTLEKQLGSLSPTHSLLLNFKSEISNYYAKKRSLETIDRRISWLQEKRSVLQKVDGEESRLMGFILWNLHNLFIEKVAFCQRTNNMKLIDLEETKTELKATLEGAFRLLKDDGGCPKELRNDANLFMK